MNLHILPRGALAAWIELLGTTYRVIGPKQKELSVQTPSGNGAARQTYDREYIFDDITAIADLALPYRSTILPPKKIFLPQKEALFGFKDHGGQIEPRFDERPTVVLGLHTCDLHAIHMLDQVFSQRFSDQHYLARRLHTTVVSIDCGVPCSENAFCKDMGTWTVPEAFDLHLTDLGNEYAIEVGSEDGAALLQGLAAVRLATKSDYQRFDQARSIKWSRFSYRLETDLNELAGLMAASYRSPVWEDLGEQCLGCGACTAVCPTCYCFDVHDEVNFDLHSGERFRVWDSCQFSQFAKVAGGHDFRNGRAARLRHRFYHKFKYQSPSADLSACVGCGRCAEACLVGINPINVLGRLQKKRAADSGKRQEVVV